MSFIEYDVIVVGGGHSGLEASSAVANMGGKVLIISMNLQNIGVMSCNPAIGGIAKGQIVKDIDALGGLTGIVTDKSMLQFRMLNKSKGPAMWSPRAQCDRVKFAFEWKKIIENNTNIDLYQDTVTELLIKQYNVIGVKTKLGIHIKSKAVILTNGTFLNGIIYLGNNKYPGGRISESNVTNLTQQLNSLGFKYGRMKTGTSPRVDKRSLNFSKMIIQSGDKNIQSFSFMFNDINLTNKQHCFITYTNNYVHEILQKNINYSPLFNGMIKSKGPRYCPSIEEKIFRFKDKSYHQIFVEPEGVFTNEMYVNGFSTSLPIDVQFKALKLIPGFENVKVLKFGYSIEYDYFFPTQLHHTLETKLINNLFFAGQINGTTGYEEAACQGLIAGINAYLKINNKIPFIVRRDQSYIGVLIDDLVTKGTQEPYRMFTSRSEYRMLLRQDNSDERLCKMGYRLGLISKERLKYVYNSINKINNFINFLKNNHIKNEDLKILNIHNIKNLNNIKCVNLSSFLSRPEVNITDLYIIPSCKKFIDNNNLTDKELDSISIYIKYQGYIDREKSKIKKMSNLYNIKLPNNLDYNIIDSISYEAKEKLNSIKPLTLGDAYNISGISPSTISILFFYIKKKSVHKNFINIS